MDLFTALFTVLPADCAAPVAQFHAAPAVLFHPALTMLFHAAFVVSDRYWP
jgi:hypothetical protein